MSFLQFFKSPFFNENRTFLWSTTNRNIGIRRRLNDKVSTNDTPPKTSPAECAIDPHTAKNVHRPNNLERRFLVWSGKYKRIEDVPKTVSYDAMERARNKARIRIANYMMAATAIACIIMAISGKKAAQRGESVQKMNLDWHKEINEKYNKEQAEANKK